MPLQVAHRNFQEAFVGSEFESLVRADPRSPSASFLICLAPVDQSYEAVRRIDLRYAA